MIKLKKKRFSLQNFTIGDVVKIFYVIFLKTKKKKKKMYSFYGLCINKKADYFELFNIVKKEKIYMFFDLRSPVIFKFLVLNLYKKIVFRVSRLYFKNTSYFFDDFKNKYNTVNSNVGSFKFDFFFSSYIKKRFMKRRKKKKRFKRKYFFSQNWRQLKKFSFENKYFFKEFNGLNPEVFNKTY